MKSKKIISVLLLLIVSTCSMIIASTPYKKYNSLEINNAGASDSVVNSTGVALPIIATYDPDISESFTVKSSNATNVNIFNGSAITTYYTATYDVTTVGETEKFTLSYINSLENTKNTYVYIYYDNQFYSEDRSKSTAMSLELIYDDDVITDDGIKLNNVKTGTTDNSSTFYINGDQSFNYSKFKFHFSKGYHNSDLIDFHFSWDPVDLEYINEDSGNTFSSGESLVAYVFIEIKEN